MRTYSELSRDSFASPVVTPRRYRVLMIIFLVLVCLLATIVELRPLKKFSPGYGWPIPRSNVLALAMDLKLTPAMRYSPGDNSISFNALPYAAVVKLAYYLLPHRLLCLRLVALVSLVVSLVFLYRTAALLFSPSVGIIAIFILVTTPVYLDEMLSYGYIPFSCMAVSVTGYVLATSLKSNNYLKTVLLSLLTYLTLPLYASARLVSVWVLSLYGVYFKRYWKSLVVFAVLIVALVAASDAIFRDGGYDFIRNNSLLSPERTPFRSIEAINWEAVRELGDRLKANIRTASYFFSLRTEPFYNHEDREWNQPVNIFSVLYFPFLLIGIMICLVNLKQNNVYLLLWFSIFFLIVLFASSRLLERRVINGLEAVAIFIAIGIRGVYLLARARSPLNKRLQYVKLVLGAILILPGGYNVYRYLDSVSQPDYVYSRVQLKEFAENVRQYGDQVQSIRYNRRTEVLIWGNPYFDYPIINRDIISKLHFWGYSRKDALRAPLKILEQVDYIRALGGNHLFIYTFEPAADGRRSEDPFWSRDDIQTVAQMPADQVELFQVPGMDEVYFMLVKEAK